MKEVIDWNIVPVNNLLLTGTLSNVWLAMPLGAGVLRWVLVCHTIEEEKQKSSLPPPPPRACMY